MHCWSAACRSPATQSATEAAHVAEAYAKRRFLAVKPRVQGNVSRDSEILKAVRLAVGDSVAMMVDANEKCDLAGARQLLFLARDHKVSFVEEPLPAQALPAYRALSKHAPDAIATGEHLQTVAVLCLTSARDWLTSFNPISR